MTHDYMRNGTATLFAALNVADDTVISMCDDRHRHQEWLQFLRVIDHVTPGGKDVHLIADNYATHKHAKVQRWLKRHPRFHPYGISGGSVIESVLLVRIPSVRQDFGNAKHDCSG